MTKRRTARQVRNQEEAHKAIRLFTGIGLAVYFAASHQDLTPPWLALIASLISLDRITAGLTYKAKLGERDAVADKDDERGGARRAGDAPRVAPYDDAPLPPDHRRLPPEQHRISIADLVLGPASKPRLAV